MKLREIEEEIYKLEHSETSWQNCEKLNLLYNVRKGMQPEQKQAEPVPRASTEFQQAFYAAPIDYTLDVLQEHFDIIKAVYPKEYTAIIKKLNSYG